MINIELLTKINTYIIFGLIVILFAMAIASYILCNPSNEYISNQLNDNVQDDNYYEQIYKVNH